MSRFSIIRSAVFCLGLLSAGAAFGYPEPDSAPAPKQLSSALPAGTRTYPPGAWGLVEVPVANGSDKPAKVLSSLFFADANRQYGRELWIPPRSRRTTWYPVFVPPDEPTGPNSRVFESILLDRTGPEERLVPTSTGQMLSDGLLPVDQGGQITGWIGGAEEMGGGGTSIPTVGDMIASARVSIDLSRKVVGIRGLALPPGSECLQGTDHLVLSGDRPLADPAGLAAIRQWVRRGGRLWVALSEVPEPLVERLLGGDCRIQPVDTVDLTAVRVEGVGPTGSSDDEARELEVPVKMVRVFADDVEVIHTVDGWPASFAQRFGRGEILFTTLGPQAWVRPRRPNDRRPPDPVNETPWVAGEPLRHIASRLATEQEDLALPAKDWQPFLAEQVGYRVLGRGTVLSTLGLSCVALAGCAVWLGRRGQLQRLGWIAPVISCVSAGVLAVAGIRSAEAVPSTVAEGQLVETTLGSTEARVSGLAMIYNQTQTEASLGAERGGVLVPDMTGFAGETTRMVWTDWDRWHWENLTLPAGVRVAPFAADAELQEPVSVKGRFGPNGFAGRISGPLREPEDAVLTGPSGDALAIEISPDGAFTAASSDLLSPGVFISESLLSDTQRRRQDFYRRLFRGPKRGGPYRDRPTLLAWSPPIDLGFVFPAGHTRTGAALVTAPLAIEATPPGTRVAIPAPFVRYNPAPGPAGEPPSPLFDKRAGEWAEATGDTTAWMRFDVPREVVPLDLEEAELTVTVAGAMGRFEILSGTGESLRTWNSPAGTLRATFRSSDGVEFDDRGGMSLGFRIQGDHRSTDQGAAADLKRYWRIESVRLGVSGRTRDASP